MAAYFFFQVERLVLREVGELTHQADEAFLDGIDERDPVGVVGGRAGEAERGVEFIDISEGFDAK